MTIETISVFLQRTIGLDAGSIGPAAIVQAVRQRREAAGMPDLHSYWAHLRSSEREQQELIEAVVVPETWFFRHPEALSALAQATRRDRLPTSPELRVLSLPCSTGEEPYSIAMMLFDAGLSAERFRIEAVDISERAIAHAERGTYGKNSFRGADLGFRDRHFEPVTAGWRVTERLRGQVDFRRANLFSEGAFQQGAAYEAIFCRNVLIYFDQPARQRAIALLHRLLTPRGMLFVGPAEAPLLSDFPFTSARIPFAFAFMRADAVAEPKPPPPQRCPLPKAPPIVDLIQTASPPAQTPAPRTQIPSPPAPPPPESDLEQAHRRADEGRFEEAMEYCERHLRQHSDSVDAHYLGGLLCDARGQRSQARDYYRRALYLDPTHYEALIHLAETLRAAGDCQAAEQLMERARRAQSRGRTG